MNRLEQAEAVLREVHGDPVWNWCFGDFGRQFNRKGRSVIVPASEVEKQLAAVRAKLQEGLVAWIGTSRWLGEGMDNLRGHVELAVAPGGSQWEILFYAGTADVNGGLETEELARKLKEWDKEYGGLRIDRAEPDRLTLTLLNPPADAEKLAREVCELCPLCDGDTQGVAKEIQSRGSLSLAWE